jgi:phosphoribosylglycinamide formyltransferase-1
MIEMSGNSRKNVAVFASGSGTNAQRIIEYFRDHPLISISLMISNKADAFVLERAAKLGVPSCVFSAKEIREVELVLRKLKEFRIEYLVLAGFLLKVPDALVKDYPNRILNIHPALLPKYGGKGMYGHYVHEAVIASGDQESGITIHRVNEHYDEGEIIFQAQCPVLPDDTPDSLAERIHSLEHRHFPGVIENWILTTP